MVPLHFALQVLQLLVHRGFLHVVVHLLLKSLHLRLVSLVLRALHVRRRLGLEGVLHWLAKLTAKGLLVRLRGLLIRVLARWLSLYNLLAQRHWIRAILRARIHISRALHVRQHCGLLPTTKPATKLVLGTRTLMTKPATKLVLGTRTLMLRRAKRVVGKTQHLACPASRRSALPLLRTQRI